MYEPLLSNSIAALAPNINPISMPMALIQYAAVPYGRRSVLIAYPSTVLITFRNKNVLAKSSLSGSGISF